MSQPPSLSATGRPFLEDGGIPDKQRNDMVGVCRGTSERRVVAKSEIELEVNEDGFHGDET